MTEDRSNETLTVYRGGTKMGSAMSTNLPVHLDLDAGDYPEGTFQGAWTSAEGIESKRADFPAVTVIALPDMPSLVITLGDTTADYTVTFSKSGGSITGATLKQSADKGTTWTDAAKLDAGKGTVTGKLTGLTNGTEYRFKVVVTGTAGTTETSAQTGIPSKPVVKMTGFTLTPTTVTGKVGDTATITLSAVLPADTTDKSVFASSADPAIATLKDNGNGTYLVTLVTTGATTLTWLANDGAGATGSVIVTVTA